MNKETITENKLAYTSPDIEITILPDGDIITASNGIEDSFWGVEHSFRSMYSSYEWQ